MLIIYANDYNNNGTINVEGTKTLHCNGGSSGGGSVNIFTNKPTNINSLGTVINVKYEELKFIFYYTDIYCYYYFK